MRALTFPNVPGVVIDMSITAHEMESVTVNLDPFGVRPVRMDVDRAGSLSIFIPMRGQMTTLESNGRLTEWRADINDGWKLADRRELW